MISENFIIISPGTSVPFLEITKFTVYKLLFISVLSNSAILFKYNNIVGKHYRWKFQYQIQIKKAN